MTAVRFNRRADTSTAVTFAYDPAIVDTIKLVVPPFLRSWNRARRETWRDGLGLDGAPARPVNGP